MPALPRRLTLALTVLVTVLAGLFAPAAAADAKAPVAMTLSTTSVPTSGGVRITVTGKNLSKVKAVYVGGKKVSKVTHVSKTKIRFTAPRHAAGTVRIKLLAGKKKYSTPLHLTYAATVHQPSSFESEVLALTNQARAAARTCGSKHFAAVPALAWNGILGSTAYAHSADMAAHDYFSHTSRDGTAFSTRITQAGYKWRNLGENIAEGQDTPAEVVDAWLNSPGHCENIMSASFTELGVGDATSGTSGHYWTQDFGRPAS